MTKIEMFENMFKLQNQLNIQIKGSNWELLKLPWHRAIWTECAELIESMNWKWWKKSPIDMMNIHIELVDIWHFGMSWMMQYKQIQIPSIAKDVFPLVQGVYDIEMRKPLQPAVIKIEDCITSCNAFSLIEEMVFDAVNTFFQWKKFFTLCYCLSLPLNKLYGLYISKQVLNKFRNNNGYAKGTYVKNWQGQEDNVYMYRFVIDNIEVTEDKIYNFLQDTYNAYNIIKDQL